MVTLCLRALVPHTPGLRGTALSLYAYDGVYLLWMSNHGGPNTSFILTFILVPLLSSPFIWSQVPSFFPKRKGSEVLSV